MSTTTEVKKIPIAKPYLDKDDAANAYDVVLSGWVTQGPKVAEFEQKFAEYTGAKYAVAVSNCTTALHLAMLMHNIGIGDEVICPSMSYIATANCIIYTGATPVFAEVDPKTYNISVEDAEKKITDKTKAILIVHQIGYPADIDAFHALGKKYNLPIIEDAACAAGSEYKAKKIGSHSELVCFSFHPRKVITTGDGGMITTSNPKFNERLRLLRQHGMSVNDRVRHNSDKVIMEDHLEVGYNYRMTDIQAAVGIKQLEKLDMIVAERRKLGQRYNEALADIDTIRTPKEEEGYFTNYQTYSVYLKPEFPLERNDLMQAMLDEGIATRRGIMTSHRESAYKETSMAQTPLPKSEEAADRSICLPLYYPMDKEDQERVISAFRRLAGM